jgi:hypothetical protein
MAHPQSSFKGLWAKNRIDIGSNQLTGDSTALVLNAGIQISAARYITANSTAFVLTAESALPGSVDAGAAFTIIRPGSI